MPQVVRTLPDTLVLGAGGTLGIAWLRGILAGIEEAAGLDLRRCEHFVGTSAGAYVAASLAAGEPASSGAGDPQDAPDAAGEFEAATDEHEVIGRRGSEGGRGGGPGDSALGRLAALGRGTAAAGRSGAAGAAAGSTRLARTATAPLIPMAVAAAGPPGAVARAAALAITPRGGHTPIDIARRSAELGAFDGRLRVVAVDRRRGNRVVFGAPGAPEAGVGEAVLASCAVPWIFAPVEIGGREYVDGGVWSMSNLDVAPARRGAEVLALLPTFRRARSRGGGGAGGGGLGLLRAAAQGAGLAELQVLRARGARARIVAPDAASAAAMGSNLMDARRRTQVTAAAREQGRRLATTAHAPRQRPPTTS